MAAARGPARRERPDLFFLTYWVPWALYLGLIFFLSSLSRPEEAVGFQVRDFLSHPVEYAILAVLTARLFRRALPELMRNRWIAVSFLFSVFYGATDEIHQYFVPGRTAAWTDWFLDIFGTSLGLAAFTLLSKRDEPLRA